MDHRLQKFLAVVEYGGFVQAARQLHVSQPALSVAVRELEKSVCTELLTRRGKQPSLTPAGQIVYESAQRMRNEWRALELGLREHQKSHTTPLRLGLLDTIASVMFASSKAALPEHIAVMVDNSDRLARELALGRIDAAVVAAPPDSSNKAITARPLHNETFVFVATKPVADQTNPRLVTNWLAFNPTSHTYAQFSKDFERHRIVAIPTFYSTSMELIRSMALMGKGVGLLPRHFVLDNLSRGELVALDTPPLARKLWFIQPSSQLEHSALRELIDRLERLV
jgi:DNA-binding transcriptional LysR family regulator